MKVRMRAEISGTRNGEDWPQKGGEIEVSGEEGAQLCALGLAEPVTADAEPETATAPDTAEKRGRGRPRKQTPGGE